jgi:hemerythrin
MDKNSIVEWNDRYAVGIRQIDDQHKVLLRLINNLYLDCFNEDEGAKKRFTLALYGLVSYIKYHFAGEEQLLERINYPDYAAHKRKHDEFIRDLIEQIEDFERRKTVSPKNFVRHIRDGLITHITLIDKKYVTYIHVINNQINNAGRSLYSVPAMRMLQPEFRSGPEEIPSEIFFG